jgi:SH3-like domain-containing protein
MYLRLCAALLMTIAAFDLAVAQARRETPYWASISSSRAMMRTGPGRNYPGTWLYVRRDLPVRVTEVYQDWRRIEDPDGATGWMFSRMLSDTRTALVRGDAPQPMHDQPDEGSPVRFRAEPGVVGHVSQCAGGWCRFDVEGRGGFIRIEAIWGVGADETVG